MPSPLKKKQGKAISENLSVEDDDDREGPVKFVGKERNLLGTGKNSKFLACSKARFMAATSPYRNYGNPFLFFSLEAIKGKEAFLDQFMAKSLQKKKEKERKNRKTKEEKLHFSFPEKEVVRKFNDYDKPNVNQIKSEITQLHQKEKSRLKELQNFRSFRFVRMDKDNLNGNPGVFQFYGPFEEKEMQQHQNHEGENGLRPSESQIHAEGPDEEVEDPLTPSFCFN